MHAIDTMTVSGKAADQLGRLCPSEIQVPPCRAHTNLHFPACRHPSATFLPAQSGSTGGEAAGERAGASTHTPSRVRTRLAATPASLNALLQLWEPVIPLKKPWKDPAQAGAEHRSQGKPQYRLWGLCMQPAAQHLIWFRGEIGGQWRVKSPLS